MTGIQRGEHSNTAPLPAASRLLVIGSEPVDPRLDHALRSCTPLSVEHIPDTSIIRLYSVPRPSLVVLDGLRDHDWEETLRRLVAHFEGPSCVPVVFCAANDEPGTGGRALALGAADVVARPISELELQERLRRVVANAVAARRADARCRLVERRIEEAIAERDEAQVEVGERLLRVIDALAPAAGQQQRRIAALAERLANAVGMPDNLLRCVRIAAGLHHVGAILDEGASLNNGDDELRHLELGSRLLANSRVPAIRAAEEAARTHHERWDGSGRWGLVGEEIPPISRIVTVAVEFLRLRDGASAIYPIAVQSACDQISAQAGRAFDPVVVAALQEMVFATDFSHAGVSTSGARLAAA